MATHPLTGARLMLEGFALLRQPCLGRFVAVPLLVNTALFMVAIAVAIRTFGHWLGGLDARLPEWLHWLDWLLWPLFLLALLTVLLLGFTLVGNLIAAPFNGLLAERVEAHLTGATAPAGPDWKRLLANLPRVLLDELRKILHALWWGIPALLATLLIPVFGPVIGFLFTAWMLTLQYSDYPMGNHDLTFRDMRALLRQRPVLCLSFGATVAALAMVPILNFIVMPAAVAGATALWVRELATLAPRRS